MQGLFTHSFVPSLNKVAGRCAGALPTKMGRVWSRSWVLIIHPTRCMPFPWWRPWGPEPKCSSIQGPIWGLGPGVALETSGGCLCSCGLVLTPPSDHMPWGSLRLGPYRAQRTTRHASPMSCLACGHPWPQQGPQWRPPAPQIRATCRVSFSVCLGGQLSPPRAAATTSSWLFSLCSPTSVIPGLLTLHRGEAGPRASLGLDCCARVGAAFWLQRWPWRSLDIFIFFSKIDAPFLFHLLRISVYANCKFMHRVQTQRRVGYLQTQQQDTAALGVAGKHLAGCFSANIHTFLKNRNGYFKPIKHKNISF